MLQLAGISKAFGARRALVDVSFEVVAGEVVLLVGPNGAGKTTLLRIATGFVDPDVGCVTIDGIAMASERSLAQARVGYLPEHAFVPPELTVRDHLMLRARLKTAVVGEGGGRNRMMAIVDEAMSVAGVTGESRATIGTLSKGFRQRVGLADALLGAPPLLVLDEPTIGMDPMQMRELRDQLTRVVQNRAVLVSSHAVTELAPLATRVAVMNQGVVVDIATPDALQSRTGSTTLEDAVVALCRKGAAT